ncbi:MAG: hypothetical protein ABI268_05780 [Rhodanobacter sp.]
MKIKMNFAVASLLALAVSAQAFAQDNASNQPAATTATAQSAQSQSNQTDCQKDENKNRDDCKKVAAYVPGAKGATVQSTGDLIPYAVAIGVVVLIAVASGGGGHKSGNTGTN